MAVWSFRILPVYVDMLGEGKRLRQIAPLLSPIGS